MNPNISVKITETTFSSCNAIVAFIFTDNSGRTNYMIKHCGMSMWFNCKLLCDYDYGHGHKKK